MAPFVLLEEVQFLGVNLATHPRPPPPAKQSLPLRQQAPRSPPSPGPSFSSIELQTLVDAREVDEPPCWEPCRGDSPEQKLAVRVPSPQGGAQPRVPGDSGTHDLGGRGALDHSVRAAPPSRPVNQGQIGLTGSGSSPSMGMGHGFYSVDSKQPLSSSVSTGRMGGASPPLPLSACLWASLRVLCRSQGLGFYSHPREISSSVRF